MVTGFTEHRIVLRRIEGAVDFHSAAVARPMPQAVRRRTSAANCVTARRAKQRERRFNTAIKLEFFENYPVVCGALGATQDLLG